MAISIVIGIVSALTYSGTATFSGKLKATLDHIANGTFRPDVQSLLWVPEGLSSISIRVYIESNVFCFPAGDGVFATMEDGTIELVDLKSNSTTVLVKLTDIKDASTSILCRGGFRLPLE